MFNLYALAKTAFRWVKRMVHSIFQREIIELNTSIDIVYNFLELGDLEAHFEPIRSDYASFIRREVERYQDEIDAVFNHNIEIYYFNVPERRRSMLPQRPRSIPLPLPENVFQKRLDDIPYKDDLAPEFYDPIMNTLMNDPVNAITNVIASDKTVMKVDFICDRTTYERFAVDNEGVRLQPQNRQTVVAVEPCKELREKIEAAIVELEAKIKISPA